MTEQFFKPQSGTDLGIYNSNQEDFTEFHLIVEDLLVSMNQKKQENRKTANTHPGKKWKKTPKKKKSLEGLGMRDLPFTF
jgi:hypothetical protein